MSIRCEIEKIAKKKEKKPAVGVFREGGVSFFSYGRLLTDSLAAASLLTEVCPYPKVTLCGLDTYHTAVFILACSHLGYSAALKEGAAGICAEGGEFISEDELYPLLLARVCTVFTSATATASATTTTSAPATTTATASAQKLPKKLK